MLRTIHPNALTIVLLGFLLRFLIAPFTLNWDFMQNTKLVDKFAKVKIAEFYRDPLAAYPPLTYRVFQVFYAPLKPFLGENYKRWLSLNDLSFVSAKGVFRFLFLLKLPVILIEILTAFLFSRLFEKSKTNKVLLFWMVNPIPVYLVAGWANVDILPLFFMIFSFYLNKKDKNFLAALALGIAVSFKLFPVFFLPFLILTQSTWKKRVLSFGVFLIPFLINQFPVIGLPQYSSHLTEGYLKQLFFAIFPVGPNRALIYFFAFYFILLFHYFLNPKVRNYFTFSFLSLIPLFVFSLFNLQWFLWIFPFTVFFYATNPKMRFPIAILYLSYAILVVLSQPSANLAMLSPLEPTLWSLEYAAKKILGAEMLYFLLNVTHTLFAVSLVISGYQILKDKNPYAQT